MTKRVLAPLALALLVGCGSQQDTATGLYKPEKLYGLAGDGEGTVLQLTYTSGDTATPQRTINLRVRAPKGAQGPLPAVVVIHGGAFNTGGHNSLKDWGRALAAAGYVAINFGNAEDEETSHCPPLGIPPNECTAEYLTKEVSEGGTIFAAMYSRPQDAAAILDQLDMIEQGAGVTIDRDRIAALGHSGGSHATMSLAGLAIDVSPSVRDRLWGEDPRFKAFVANSPQGVGRLGVHDTSWDKIDRPVLIQTGPGDTTDGEQAESRRDAFKHLKGPGVFEHYLNDATAKHPQFALEQDPGVTGNEQYLAATAVAFLDAYLKGRAEAVDWLASDALTGATKGVSTLLRK
jgi:dienelactone hydrolase